jgi:hypothetical protein
MKVVFDIDDTLWKIVGKAPNFRQVPDYDLIAVLRWFYQNGDRVFVWSAGGTDYAQTVVDKLGLTEMVKVVQKNSELKPDLTFDDQAMTLGNVNIRVRRTTENA